LGSKGPRVMKVLIPDVSEDGTIIQFKPLSPKDPANILTQFKQGNQKGMRYLFNKPPKWNEGDLL